MCVCVRMDSGTHVCSHAYAQVCAFTELENLTSLSSATIQLFLFVRALLLLWISLNRLVWLAREPQEFTFPPVPPHPQAFYMGSGGETRVRMFARQALCRLSHLPSPVFQPSFNDMMSATLFQGSFLKPLMYLFMIYSSHEYLLRAYFVLGRQPERGV